MTVNAAKSRMINAKHGSNSIIRLFEYSITSSPRSGFTLVELIIVVGIIAILSGILLVTFRGGTENALAAQCLSNMKNLANACQTYGAAHSHYPPAGPLEAVYIEKESDGDRTMARPQYTERPGWISNDSRGKFPKSSDNGKWAPSFVTCKSIGFAEQDQETADYALQHGALWPFIRKSSAYVCPKHQRKYRQQRINWSYLMSGRFYYDKSNGSRTCTKAYGDGVNYGELATADRTLLFSEIPFMGTSSWQPEGNSGSTDSDAVLQYADGETIGANHMIGKLLYAHVAFADGHVEKLRIPYTGPIKSPVANENQLKNLTEWLCTGKDISFDGTQYRKVE